MDPLPAGGGRGGSAAPWNSPRSRSSAAAGRRGAGEGSPGQRGRAESPGVLTRKRAINPLMNIVRAGANPQLRQRPALSAAASGALSPSELSLFRRPRRGRPDGQLGGCLLL